jgi:hypothetical protein
MTNPLQSDDPLAPLLLAPAQGPAVPVRYRSGRLLTWDIRTGENTVQIDGASFTNLPILPGSYLGVIVAGDTIALLSTTDDRGVTTYAIQGVSLTPPDVRIGRAARRPGYAKYERRKNEFSGGTGVTSATYVAIANTIPVDFFKTAADSPIEVTLSGTLYTNGAAAPQLGVRIDGSTDQDVLLISLTNELDVAHASYSHSTLIDTALTAGSHTFQPVWYKASGAGNMNVDAGDVFSMTIREVA